MEMKQYNNLQTPRVNITGYQSYGKLWLWLDIEKVNMLYSMSLHEVFLRIQLYFTNQTKHFKLFALAKTIYTVVNVQQLL